MIPAYFICYRREDAGYAAALSRALVERHGPGQVFKDITSLPLARDWRTEVSSALDRSTHVLVLIGARWMAGVDADGMRGGRQDPIVFEVTEALRRGRAVVPVLLGEERMPPAHQLPGPLRRLADLGAAYVRTESTDTDIAGLVDRLPQPAVGPAPRPRVRQAPTTAPRRRALGWIVALAVVLAVVAGGIALVPDLLATVRGIVGPGSTPVLNIDPTRGRTGTWVTATASGFSPGSTVQFLFQGRELAESLVDANGNATGSFGVPNGPDGTWTVTATQQGSARSDNALFTRLEQG